jgi:tRNA modification GTPase
MFQKEKTICAISTPPGLGGIAVIRLSGASTHSILNKVFSKDLSSVDTHTVHFGLIKDGDHIIDEVVATVFKGPNSFTGEDVVEISCHGSVYIQNKIIEVLLANGASLAEPGEFTLRAFLNGKMDLSQAEAVADLIHSNSEGAHDLAMKQMRGGFSKEIDKLRQELIDFASLIELELDFSEEDVEFADRTQLNNLINQIQSYLNSLIDSFRLGNVIKNGVPVAIVGVPNVGKSTLLNALLNEDRAIVSDIPGTTRDAIEDQINIGGIIFRFIDTAGIRKTKDQIETKGIKKTFEKIEEAEIILYLIDTSDHDITATVNFVNQFRLDASTQGKELILVLNKTDILGNEISKWEDAFSDFEKKVFISAKDKSNVDEIESRLLDYLSNRKNADSTLVTSQRHYEALTNCNESLDKVLDGLNQGISGDLLAMDIRDALHSLGTITGSISTDDLLGNIFGKFCIGK